MAKYSKAEVRELVSLVGGSDNVAAVSHCVTRMRFVLKNEGLANVEKIGELKR
jgi:PTS system trehalose-specific IIC component